MVQDGSERTPAVPVCISWTQERSFREKSCGIGAADRIPLCLSSVRRACLPRQALVRPDSSRDTGKPVARREILRVGVHQSGTAGTGTSCPPGGRSPEGRTDTATTIHTTGFAIMRHAERRRVVSSDIVARGAVVRTHRRDTRGLSGASIYRSPGTSDLASGQDGRPPITPFAESGKDPNGAIDHTPVFHYGRPALRARAVEGRHVNPMVRVSEAASIALDSMMKLAWDPCRWMSVKDLGELLSASSAHLAKVL